MQHIMIDQDFAWHRLCYVVWILLSIQIGIHASLGNLCAGLVELKRLGCKTWPKLTKYVFHITFAVIAYRFACRMFYLRLTTLKEY